MSTESESGDIERAFVSPDECAAWRKRVHDGDTIQEVTRDVSEWSYTTVFEHVHENYTCNHEDDHDVSPVEGQESNCRGIQQPPTVERETVRAGLREALAANYGDTANIRIKTFRKRRDIDVAGQRIGVVMRELVDGDPRDEFDVERSNPDANVGRWHVSYADGGKQ